MRTWLLLSLLMGLIAGVAPASGEKVDPIPRDWEQREQKDPYILGEIRGETRIPQPDFGKVKVRFRLIRKHLVEVGPTVEFNREWELLKVLQHKEPEYRSAAIEELLRYYRSVRAARAICRLLSDGDMKVRQDAAFALGQMGYRGAIRPLIDILPYCFSDVKQTVAISLEKLTKQNYGTSHAKWWTWYMEFRWKIYQEEWKPEPPPEPGSKPKQDDPKSKEKTPATLKSSSVKAKSQNSSKRAE